MLTDKQRRHIEVYDDAHGYVVVRARQWWENRGNVWTDEMQAYAERVDSAAEARIAASPPHDPTAGMVWDNAYAWMGARGD